MDQDSFVNIGDFDPESVSLEEPPQTAEHYLKQVMVDRRKCEQIVKKEFDGTNLRKQTQCVTVEKNESKFPTPPKVWQDAQCSSFSLLRSHLEILRARLKANNSLGSWKFPNLTNESGWKALCLRKRSEAEDVPDLADAKFSAHQGTPPVMKMVLSLTSVQSNQLFEFMTEWLAEDGYSAAQMQWLFAVMCVLEKPLDADVCSAMRTLCRQCRVLRDTLPPPALSNDLQHQRMGREFSFFIALCALYFEQKDLADPAI